MARYRVEFSRDWIMGRWGFIDHMFYKMGGKPADRARMENAWLVDCKKGPGALGRMLADRLELKPADYSQFGVIFDIRELGRPEITAVEHHRPAPRARLRTPER